MRVVLLVTVLLFSGAGFGSGFYASSHPGRARAAMEALHFWPSITPTPRPTATPTAPAKPTATPKTTPTSTDLPYVAVVRPTQYLDGGGPEPSPTAASVTDGLTRPSDASLPIDFIDESTGAGVALSDASTKRQIDPYTTLDAGMQYLLVSVEERYFGSDSYWSSSGNFELQDDGGYVITPDFMGSNLDSKDLPSTGRNAGWLVFQVPEGKGVYGVQWQENGQWKLLGSISVHAHALPEITSF